MSFADVVTTSGTTCPSCEKGEGRIFYRVENIPTSNARLSRTRQDALSERNRAGRMHLAFCPACGFMWNAAFDPGLVDYGEDYESTQSHSPTFRAFHEKLARSLFERYGLQGKEVFEIGCGPEAEFVHLLARFGARRVVGIDPALKSTEAPAGVELIRDYYGPKYRELRPDFVASKMTMEHIPDPAHFLAMLRRTIGDRRDAICFAMMPEARRVLEHRAFWDIYYEHCAYFTLGSLARAFRFAGFDPFDLDTDFGDHYCLIAARPGRGDSAPLPKEESPADMAGVVEAFAGEVDRIRRAWVSWLRAEQAAGRRTVLWGAGSKAVAFATTLGLEDELAFAVDISPPRHGTFITGTGHDISSPKRLMAEPADNVVIMSPIYRDEIRADLEAMGLTPAIRSIEDPPR